MKSDLPSLKYKGYYIIAPENPSSGSVNVSSWEQIWQYGSNEDNFDTKPWILDGVAPQAPIQNIGNNRVFIPDGSDGEEAVYQDFYFSHRIQMYDWIFEKTSTKKGYVAPRK